MSWADWMDLIRLFAPVLITAAALGIAGGVVGVFVLLRGEPLMALSLPQIVAVGAALSLRWELVGWKALPPPLAVSLAALAFFVLAKRRGRSAGGAGAGGAGAWTLPSFYVAGLCLSFLLIANKGQEVSELQKFFTGIDVAVAPEQAMVSAPILLLVAIVTATLWRRWLLVAQAPAAAELAGLRPHRWDALFLLLLTTATLLGTYSMGVVMVLVMLFLPAAAVLPWARRIPGALVSAAALSLLFLAAGFYLSNTMNWPLSQSVGGVGFAVVVLMHLVARR